MQIRNKNDSWEAIFNELNIDSHNFDKGPFELSAVDIKQVFSRLGVTKNSLKEPRTLCKQDTRESRPEVFVKNDLFILPRRNGHYSIFKGEGYVDIPDINSDPIEYNSQLLFELESAKVGNSEMQHLDKAYASSILRTFANDESLVLTIRGRKYTPPFVFNVAGHPFKVEGVQTEVDAGYEGRDQIVLVEAKNGKTKNTIIRQLYYPYRQWKMQVNKDIKLVFFEKDHCKEVFKFWEFGFDQQDEYSSIRLFKSAKYEIV